MHGKEDTPPSPPSPPRLYSGEIDNHFPRNVPARRKFRSFLLPAKKYYQHFIRNRLRERELPWTEITKLQHFLGVHSRETKICLFYFTSRNIVIRTFSEIVSARENFLACGTQQNGVLGLGNVRSADVTDGRVRVYQPRVAEVLQRANILLLQTPCVNKTNKKREKRTSQHPGRTKNIRQKVIPHC